MSELLHIELISIGSVYESQVDNHIGGAMDSSDSQDQTRLSDNRLVLKVIERCSLVSGAKLCYPTRRARSWSR